MPQVIVIGAGPAGLEATRQLVKRGVDVIILEAIYRYLNGSGQGGQEDEKDQAGSGLASALDRDGHVGNAEAGHDDGLWKKVKGGSCAAEDCSFTRHFPKSL